MVSSYFIFAFLESGFIDHLAFILRGFSLRIRMHMGLFQVLFSHQLFLCIDRLGTFPSKCHNFYLDFILGLWEDGDRFIISICDFLMVW